jgi:protein-S-isoprenylcysteine O-methyltransferase Ste14
MHKRLSRWGVGPKIVLSVVVYGLMAWAATGLWPERCSMDWLPRSVSLAAGAILVSLGLPMWLVAAVSVMRAYNRDELVVSGVFRLCRHPLYGAWIVLLLPGIAILTRSWPFLLMPFVAYGVFKSLIGREDNYLEERFGKAYIDYRERTSEVVPIPRYES